MNRYAIVRGDLVTNVVLWDGNSDTWQPEEGTAAHLLEDLAAGPGWAYRDGQFLSPVSVPPSFTLDGLKAALMVAATARRWEVETGGLSLPSGVRLGTTKDDQDRITAVLVNAANARLADFDFKARSGWVTLTLAQLQQMAAAITLHVQACFSAERSHHEAIAALQSAEEANAYDISTGWPG